MRIATKSALLLALCLTACGGGGSGGSTFTLSGTSAAFTAVEEGAAPTRKALTLTITSPAVVYLGAEYRNGQSQPSWLGIDLVAAPGDGSTWLVELSVLRTDLPPGTYTSTFAVGTANGNGDVLDARDVTVTYTVTPHAPLLRSAQTAIVLGGADGTSSAPVALTFSLDSSVIASCEYAVALSTTSGGDWLRASAEAGTVGPAGTQVQLSATPGVASGTYAGEARISCTADGMPLALTVPVTLRVEAHRLAVDTVGVGFSSAPSRTVLSRDVPVRSSLGRTGVAWSASADQSWLTVTASGTTPGSIHLSADPVGLTADTTHFATVTVTSPDPSVENVETIRVGLAVRSTDPVVAKQPDTFAFLVTSPVEPIVFVSNGGTDVIGYDVYSGAAVRTFTGVATTAGTLAMSGDGLRLFVWDRSAARVAELDAVTGDLVRSHGSAPVGTSSPGLATGLAWVRPAGAPVLITPSSRMYDLTSGAELADRFAPAPSTESLQPSPDGARVVTVTGAVYRIRHTALDGGRTWGEYDSGTTYTGAAAGQACFGADGVRVYRAAGSPYDFTVWNTTTGKSETSLPGTAYPNSMACSWNGVVVGGSMSYYDATDVWAYDGATGASLATYNSTSVANTTYRSLAARGLAISADGTRLVTLVGSSYSDRRGVRFQTLPPP